MKCWGGCEQQARSQMAAGMGDAMAVAEDGLAVSYKIKDAHAM